VTQLCTKSWFSIAKAEKILGWKPEMPFEEGMQRSKTWAQQQDLI
jgi:nucleoside-diphosphate-sugar epimerase